MNIGIESEKNILRILSKRFNKWWQKQALEVPEFRRGDFHYLKDRLAQPRAVTIIGPRQVGKTTVVMQLIKELLEEKKVEPKRILYVALDDQNLRREAGENTLLLDVLEVYQKNVLLEDLDSVKIKTYLFFDEVQKIPQWAEVVKTLVDSNKNIQIVSTGSASFKISQASKETLPGRQELYTMLPLKFADSIKLRRAMGFNELNAEELKSIGLSLKDGLERALLTPDSLPQFFDECKKYYLKNAAQETSVQAELRAYLAKGGYPEIISTKDAPTCQKLLLGYANDVIIKDLMPWFKIRDIETAEKLLFLLAAISGEKLNIEEILKRLPGSNKVTIRNYVDYFKSVDLISTLPVYSGLKMGSTKHPKIYFSDVGMKNALAGVLDAPLHETEKGLLAETTAFDHIKRLAYKLNAASEGKIFCYCGEKGEVDFILDLPRQKTKLAIEVKFRRSIKDLDGIKEFMQEKKAEVGLVLTEGTLEKRGEIVLIPLWLFLLMC